MCYASKPEVNGNLIKRLLNYGRTKCSPRGINLWWVDQDGRLLFSFIVSDIPC